MPEHSKELRFKIGTSGQSLIFAKTVIDHLCSHRQIGWFSTEGGGQLFARIEESEVRVEVATGPRRSDGRWRFSYVPDRTAEQDEIANYYAQGLHFIGDWHTHPEQCPSPSNIDLHSIAECVQKSKHALAGFVHVVVGQASPPKGWCVLVHDGRDAHRL